MKTVVGIDEVGRGPLAGPVSVCVVSCDFHVYKKLRRSRELPSAGKDSKKLKSLERENYDKILKILEKEGKISYKVIHISNKIIDSRGLSFSIRKAISRGLDKLKLNPKTSLILLDGGLKAPPEFKNQKTIIKGDEKEKVISWASILAKVSRDALMSRFSVKYPQYSFDIHKGYGTEKHLKAIQRYGISAIHRGSFISH